jgi:hypothetical protein
VKAATVLAGDMSENDLLATVRQACKTLHLLCYHTYRSDRSEKGFPDLVIVGVRGILFRELKNEKDKPTIHQQQWIQALQTAGADAGLWRPSDLYNGRITHELRRIAACKR